MMAYNEIMEFINFVEQMLYLFVAFMCGLIIGVIASSLGGGDE